MSDWKDTISIRWHGYVKAAADSCKEQPATDVSTGKDSAPREQALLGMEAAALLLLRRIVTAKGMRRVHGTPPLAAASPVH